MFDIIELQHKLTAANEEKATKESNYSRVVARTARLNNNIDMLLKRDTTPLHVSQILGIPIDIVQSRLAKLERNEAERREFLQLGIMSESLRTGGHVAVFR